MTAGKTEVFVSFSVPAPVTVNANGDTIDGNGTILRR